MLKRCHFMIIEREINIRAAEARAIITLSKKKASYNNLILIG